MAVTSKNVQDLQDELKDQLKKGVSEGDVIPIGYGSDKRYYQVIHHQNDVTQGLGVVPVDNKRGDNPQFDQAIIVIAGTQVPGDQGELRLEQVPSTFNAVGAGGIGSWGGLTAQTEEVDQFYQDTLTKLNAQVQNGVTVDIPIISGHSQAGPATAKVGARYNISRIYNFQPWKSQRAVDSGQITQDEVAYLDKHAIIFSDSKKSVTKFDGDSGKIAYGKVYTVEGDNHSVGFFKIKGNNLDVDYYVKQGLFVTGMTEAQVIEASKIKANCAKDFNLFELGTWNDSTNYKDYVEEYKKTYGGFATAKIKPRGSLNSVVSPSRSSYRTQLLAQTKASSAHLRAFGRHLSTRGYSDSAMIFIDEAQTALLANHMEEVAEDSHDQLERLLDRTVERARQLWDAVDLWSYRDLQEWEVLAIFEEAGVGPGMIDKVQKLCQDTVNRSKAIKQNLMTLASEARTAVQKSLENDQALAGEFNQWQHQI